MKGNQEIVEYSRSFDANYIVLICRCISCEITFESPAKRKPISADMFKGVVCPDCGDPNPNVIRSKGGLHELHTQAKTHSS